MAMGVVASGVKGKTGKPRNPIHTKQKGIVSKDGPHGGAKVVGAECGVINEHAVSRFLAKAAVNIMTHEMGSVGAMATFPDLIRFVRMPKSRREVWAYEARYMLLGPQPDWRILRSGAGIEDPSSQYVAVSIGCSSGVFIIPLYRDDETFRGPAVQLLDNTVKGHFSMPYSTRYKDGKAGRQTS